jgi:hypothetical protein
MSMTQVVNEDHVDLLSTWRAQSVGLFMLNSDTENIISSKFWNGEREYDVVSNTVVYLSNSVPIPE